MTHGHYRGHKSNGKRGGAYVVQTKAWLTPNINVALGEGEAANYETGEIVTRIEGGATPVAKRQAHVCREFGVAENALCPFCNNGYRAPELIRMIVSDSGRAARCNHCGWVCTL